MNIVSFIGALFGASLLTYGLAEVWDKRTYDSVAAGYGQNL
jgi:hypothetical protein